MADSREKLTRTTVGLHWIIAFGMIAMLAVGLYIEDLERGPERSFLIGLHKSFGVLILILAMGRILWRWRNGFPINLSAMPPWQDLAARTTHWLLLIGTVLMPITGAMMSIGSGYGIAVFGLELVPRSTVKYETMAGVGRTAHWIAGYALIAAILLHIAGAAKHHVVDKDGTLRRMLGARV